MFLKIMNKEEINEFEKGWCIYADYDQLILFNGWLVGLVVTKDGLYELEEEDMDYVFDGEEEKAITYYILGEKIGSRI